MGENRIKLYISSLSILLFLLFLSFQVLHTLRYYNYAKDGQVYTNIVWREDEAIQWIKDNTDPQDHIYSNYADAVHFLTKKSIKYLPFRGAEESIRYFFARERGTVRTYVIAFKEVSWRGYVLTNDDIVENNKKYKTLFVIKDFPRAVIYKFKQ